MSLDDSGPTHPLRLRAHHRRNADVVPFDRDTNSGRDQAMGKTSAFPACPYSITPTQLLQYNDMKNEYDKAQKTIDDRNRELKSDTLSIAKRQSKEVDRANAEQKLPVILSKAKKLVADITADVQWGGIGYGRME